MNVVYSSLRDLDVLPGRANKGNALAWLCRRICRPAGAGARRRRHRQRQQHVSAARACNGIVVENAQPELFEAVVKLPTFVPTQDHGRRRARGLRAFRRHSARAAARSRARPGHGPRGLAGHAVRSRSRCNRCGRGPRSHREGLRDGARSRCERNITPLGFSACSLADNEVTGTDANYRSVWARDGCFTVVQTVEMNDPDHSRGATRDAGHAARCDRAQRPDARQRAHRRPRSPTTPASAASARSTAGSGSIIAVYHLRHAHRATSRCSPSIAGQLQRVMDWLGAHDSNNDGLLEVPEAGDWTDLFGRSYHVLYDEVLWYRANVCYGRLLEYSARFRARRRLSALVAAHRGQDPGHLLALDARRPGRPRDSPSPTGSSRSATRNTSRRDHALRLQLALRRAGNVLAFLTNVIDVERARTAFRFMWGVGVNQPAPSRTSIRRCSPAIRTGGPTYTVNLLNLPHHYHNGGIWPFIGGMWVRFIHRLGLHDSRCSELVKLAQLNRLGNSAPMGIQRMGSRPDRPAHGQGFQAWSAAAYLRACQELELVVDETDRD